jgi:uncharacterized Fe-S cluster-containing radical SAM superfamily protein
MLDTHCCSCQERLVAARHRIALVQRQGASRCSSIMRAAGKSYDRLFFGFSSVICMRAEQRTREAIAAVPDDRLLLETDINDGAQIESLMNDIAQVVMDVKQWTRQQLAEITNANADRFFRQFDARTIDETQAADDSMTMTMTMTIDDNDEEFDVNFNVVIQLQLTKKKKKNQCKS